MASAQFNLLPGLKLQMIRAQSLRNKILSVAIVVGGVCLAIFIIMLLTVEGLQKKQLSDSNKQIATATASISAQPQITKILTVQNQLASLATLHAGKNITSRAFDYLSQVTPINVNLARLSLDYGNKTLSLDGTADSAASVNKFIDTLKFTKYTIGNGDVKNAKNAFSSVIETNFAIGSGNTSFSLSVQFDPKLFSNDNRGADGQPIAPTLSVPSQTTTRSALEDPKSLFNSSGGQ